MERYSEIVLNAVFPPHCVVCADDGDWLCHACFSLIEFLPIDPCPHCADIQPGHICSFERTDLDGLVAIGFYHNPQLRGLIHALKYQSATSVLPLISKVIHKYADIRCHAWPWAGLSELAIQSVSGVPARIVARGFDQAELIRDIVHSEIIPWSTPLSLLERSAGQSVQAELEVGVLRQANVKGVFSIRKTFPGPIPSTVLLVDDVSTSGATMHEAARVLKRAGVKTVYGFVFALGK